MLEGWVGAAWPRLARFDLCLTFAVFRGLLRIARYGAKRKEKAREASGASHDVVKARKKNVVADESFCDDKVGEAGWLVLYPGYLIQFAIDFFWKRRTISDERRPSERFVRPRPDN